MTHLSDWFNALLGRISVFFVTASLILGFYYVLGNFQGFLDSTQSMLLALLEYASLAGFIVELYRIVFFFIHAGHGKKSRPGALIRAVAFFLYFLFIYVLIKFLASWL